MRKAHGLEEQLTMKKLGLVLLLLGSVGLAACDDGNPSDGDGGNQQHDAGSDSGPMPVAPVVIRTIPANDQREVATNSEISIVFDRAMRTSEGVIRATAGADTIALGAIRWDADGRTATVAPTSPLPSRTTITVTATEFKSAEGGVLASAHTWSFETRDEAAPFVVRTSPAEGATGIDPDLHVIVIEFSEPLRDGGIPRLEGGPGTLGRAMWSGNELHLPVSGLAADTAYRLVLEGYRDPAGNALDPEPVLGDGALDFTTGDDVTPPVVVDSNPSEGQLDVRVGLVTRIAVDFSEPMDTTAGTATLEVDGGSVALTPEWSRGDTRASFVVDQLLLIDREHRLVLEGFRDLAGNAFDPVAYLGDGALDFTTGQGALTPFVAHTEPVEGDLSVPAGEYSTIRVVFSEAMSTARDTVELRDGAAVQVLQGTWNEARTILTLDARGRVHAGTSYTIDFTGFVDATGSPLDTTHPYLGDGVLSFTTAPGTGERCGDELSMSAGTPIPGGGVEWVLPSGIVTFDDGSAAACRTSASGADIVLHYRKTSPAAADGGRALHIVADNASTSTINLAVFTDRCDVEDLSTLRRCLAGHDPWETYVDGGPGDYFIWVGRTSGTFNGATVTVTEVELPDEGEACLHPFDTTSSSAVYTPPAEPTEPHRWTIPAFAVTSYDINPVMGGEGAISCAPNRRHGADAVVRIDKSTDTSIVTVRMSGAGTGTSAVDAHFEVLDSCDPLAPGANSLGCHASLDAANGWREVTIEGPAGPRYVWVGAQNPTSTFPGATIEATELEPVMGDSCANAIPLTSGTTNSVSVTRPYRAHAPECLTSGGITWFRFTAREGLSLVRTNGGTLGAVVDPTGGQVWRCGDDPQSEGLPVFAPPGTDVCIALTSTEAVSQITIDEIPYNGVRGIETKLPIKRPDDAKPGDPTLSTGGWMANFAGRIWSGQFQRIFHAPLSGGDYEWHNFTSFSCRYAGLVRPDGIYCVSEHTVVTTPRLYRIVDATGTPLATPEAIDVLPEGFEYPNLRFDGLAWDGTQFIIGTSSRTSTSEDATSFYAIPATGGAPTLLGTSVVLNDVGGLAADADYLYIAGRVGTEEGIWRLRRDALSDPEQIPHLVAGGFDLISDGVAIAIDDTTAANVLYFRTIGNSGSSAHVMVVVDPRADTPRWVGKLWRAPGNRQDNGFGYDPSGPSLYLIHTNGDTRGIWVRLD